MKKSIKIVTAAAFVFFLAILSTISASADIVSGLQQMESELTSTVKNIMDTVVIPVLLLADAIFFVINLVSFMGHRRNGEDYKKEGWAMAITIAVGILLGTWYSWGAALLP